MGGLHNFKLNTGKGSTSENYSADGIGHSNRAVGSVLEMRKQLLKIIIICLCYEEEKFINAEKDSGKQCFQLNRVRATTTFAKSETWIFNYFFLL